MTAKARTVLAGDDIKVSYKFRPIYGGAADASILDPLGITPSNNSTTLIPGVEPRQLFSQNCGLKLIQSAITPAPQNRVVLAFPTVLPQLAHSRRNSIIVCQNGTGVPKSPKVFRRVETEGCGSSKASGATPVPARTMGLSAVLKKWYARRAHDRKYSVH